MPDEPKAGKGRRGKTNQQILVEDHAKFGDAERALLESVAAAALAKVDAAAARSTEARPVILVPDRARTKRRSAPVAAKSARRQPRAPTGELALASDAVDSSDHDHESSFASISEFESAASIASEPTD